MIEWQEHSFSDLLEEPLRNGRSVPTAVGGFPVLRLTAIRNGTVDLGERKPGAWTREDAQPFLVRRGDFMIVRGNGTLSLVGRGALVRHQPDEVAFPDTLIRARAKKSKVVPEFLALIWDSEVVRNQIEQLARTSAGIYKVNQPSLARVRLRLPPLSEQRRIVNILNYHLASLDASRTAIDSAARRIKTLRSAVLERLFGIGEASTVPLGEYVREISAGKSYGASASPAGPDEWGIIKVSAMTWGTFRGTENKGVPADLADARFEVRAGDLLLSRANTSEYVGACVLVPDDVRPRLLLSDKSLRIVPVATAVPEWLWRTLQTPTVRRQISQRATGTKDSMRNISQDALLSVELPRTSGAQQRAAVRDYRDIDGALKRLEAEVQSTQGRAEALRRAILAAAFSGRLTRIESDTDVVDETVEKESA